MDIFISQIKRKQNTDYKVDYYWR